jgi:selenium metabolism protein YedF
VNRATVRPFDRPFGHELPSGLSLRVEDKAEWLTAHRKQRDGMKTIKVDARGLDCPEPVILSKKALSDIEQGDVIVQVDSEVAKENIARMAKHEGCAVTIKEHGKQGFELHLTKPEPGEKHRASETRAKGDEESVAYLFDSDFIGTNRELGKILVNGFLNAISSLPHKKNSIIFISNGVKLTTRGSYVLEALGKMHDRGYAMLICGTCLDYFKIRDKVKVGTISNAVEIVQTLIRAGKVIKF